MTIGSIITFVCKSVFGTTFITCGALYLTKPKDESLKKYYAESVSKNINGDKEPSNIMERLVSKVGNKIVSKTAEITSEFTISDFILFKIGKGNTLDSSNEYYLGILQQWIPINLK